MVYCILSNSMFAASTASLCAAAATPNLLASTLTEPATTSGLIKYGTALAALACVLNGCGSMQSQPISLQDSSEKTPSKPKRDKICQGPPYSAKIDYDKTAKDWQNAENNIIGCNWNPTNFCIGVELSRFFPPIQQTGKKNLEGITIITLEADIEPKDFDKKIAVKGLRALTLNEAMQLTLQCINVLEEKLFVAGSTIYDGPDYAVPNIEKAKPRKFMDPKVPYINRYHTYELLKGWRIPVVPASE